MAGSRDKTAEAAAKFALLETVVLDDRCSPLMVRLVHVFSAMTSSTGDAWPSYSTLEFITGAAKQNLQIAVERLWQTGYLVSISKDEKAGNSKSNRYRLANVSELSPVWALNRASKAYRDARQRAQAMSPKDARQHLKDARQRSFTAMLACPDPLKGPLGIESSSDTDVSGAAVASPIWKGSSGDPLPKGFPDTEAMQWAEMYAGVNGVDLDVVSVRRAFRSHQYAVRCLLTDWPKSWEMWVESAVDNADTLP